jgi:AraC family transcriptional regulator
MNVTHLQLSISDAALMASSDGAYGEVALRAWRKFGNPRLSALLQPLIRRWLLAFRAGGCLCCNSSFP